MNIQVILTVAVLLTLVLATGAPTIASAQYYSDTYIDEKTGAMTLEEALKIQSGQVALAGSTQSQVCSPALALSPNSALMIIGTTLLGGIGAIFFINGRSGKCAAIGRG